MMTYSAISMKEPVIAVFWPELAVPGQMFHVKHAAREPHMQASGRGTGVARG